MAIGPLLSPLAREAQGATLQIDQATRANLELVRRLAGEIARPIPGYFRRRKPLNPAVSGSYSPVPASSPLERRTMRSPRMRVMALSHAAETLFTRRRTPMNDEARVREIAGMIMSMITSVARSRMW